MMGSNGGHNSTGGAVINGPFSLQEGWSCNLALHRSSWFRFTASQGDNDSKGQDSKTDMQQSSMGRSIVRYLGDFEDLATTADVIEFTKSKAVFGPDKLILRDENVLPVTNEAKSKDDKPPWLPRGTISCGSVIVSSSTACLSSISEHSFGSYDSCDESLESSQSTPLVVRKYE